MSGPGKGVSEFVSEATEVLEAFNRELTLLDDRRGQEPPPEQVNGIFRAAHSLKGLSALFGEERIASLAHRAEDVLDRLRLGKANLSDELLDALVESTDVFQALLDEAAREVRSEEWTQRAEQLGERLDQVAQSTPPALRDDLEDAGIEPEILTALTEYEEHRLRESVRKGVALWKIRARYPLAEFQAALAKLNGRLKAVGEVIATLPSPEPAEEGAIGFELVAAVSLSRKELLARLAPLEVDALPVRRTKKARPLARPPPAVGLSRPSPPVPVKKLEVTLRSLTQTVRVDIRRLDELMNTVGELLLIKGNLQRLAESARQQGVHAISKLWGQELGREGRQLERKLDELQKGLLQARMVPLNQIFDRLARVLKRFGREAGKEVDLTVSGGEVELDKLIIEQLSDPLMHVIHNALVHGVEAPERRMGVGKPRRGTIGLKAIQKGSQVTLSVSDDGGGIDPTRVRDAALQRRLIGSDRARELSAREMQNLIFLPGFSTAPSVSRLSGRGVGLDVVRTNISNLSGAIDVASELGQGTTFSITLPVTLAIVRALLVSVSGRTYALPVNSVLEIVALFEGAIERSARGEEIRVREEPVVLARLARLFGHAERSAGPAFAAVVGVGHGRLAIAVDELLGQQDIVIKPLGERLEQIRGIAGATDLGNRRTVLVLDVGELADEVLRAEGRAVGF